MQRIEIYTSRKKSFLLLLVALAFLIVSVWMFLHAEKMADGMHRNPMLIQGIAIMGILFSGPGVFVTLRKLITKQLALVIDHRGLGFNISKSNNEYIPWSEIIDFKEIKIRQVRIIIIRVKNPQKWPEKEKRFFRKKLMQANLTNYGSPFNVSTVGLDIPHGELMEKLSVYQNTINGVSANA